MTALIVCVDQRKDFRLVVRQCHVTAPDLFNCNNDRFMDVVCERFLSDQIGDYDQIDKNYACGTTLFCCWIAIKLEWISGLLQGEHHCKQFNL